MKKKNHDYDEAWRSMRVSSYTDLILTKIERIKEIENLGARRSSQKVSMPTIWTSSTMRSLA